MSHIQFNAEAAKNIDAYVEYYNIVGNDDNGKMMSEAEFEEYKNNVRKARINRLYVSWRNTKGLDCKMIGPSSTCFCGHRYRDHTFDNIDTRDIHCKVKKCICPMFNYVPVYGSSDLKCLCKHSFKFHDPLSKKCQTAKCSCHKFSTTHSCSCGLQVPEHRTVFESRKERAAQGRGVDPNWMQDNLAGGMGGLSNFDAMIDGAEREQMMAPIMPGESAGKKAISGPAAHRALPGTEEEGEFEDRKEDFENESGSKALVGVGMGQVGGTAYQLFVTPHRYGGGSHAPLAIKGGMHAPKPALKAAPVRAPVAKAPAKAMPKYGAGLAKRK